MPKRPPSSSTASAKIGVATKRRMKSVNQSIDRDIESCESTGESSDESDELSSSDGEDDTSVEESSGDDDESFNFPSKSYQRTSLEYTSNQKKLEEHYEYEWIEGEKVYEDDVKNEILLPSIERKEILASSLTELFEYFFSKELKTYIIESTNSQGYSLSVEDFDKLIRIILFSTINKRLSQIHYWSSDPLLKSEIVISTMSRDKFEGIKSNIKCYKPEDKNDDDVVWKFKKVSEIFKKNIMRYGFFTTSLSIDEMMLK